MTSQPLFRTLAAFGGIIQKIKRSSNNNNIIVPPNFNGLDGTRPRCSSQNNATTISTCTCSRKMRSVSPLPLLYLLVALVCLQDAAASDVKVKVTEGPSANGGSCPSVDDTISTGDYVKFQMTVSIDASSKAGKVGQVFQTTVDPVGVTVGRAEVIDGLDSGLLGLCLGDKATIIVPPELAYGSDGTGDGPDDIPPGATLQFKVEIVSVMDDRMDDEVEDEEEAAAMFQRADKNKDGVLDRDEFNDMFLDQIDNVNDKLELEAIHEQLQTFWDAQDHNKDGLLTMEVSNNNHV
jgi:FKBP-type peptidyl-prolyl cis-trans isomerase 2